MHIYNNVNTYINNDNINTENIKSLLNEKTEVILFESIDSTNNYIKKNYKSLEYGTTVIAKSQTAGKGRLGRSFLSYENSGIYMSIYLKALPESEQSLKITAAAAVAVSRAIEKCTSESPQIKWVNDLILGNKKIAGILCEGIVSSESGKLEGVVLGIGINVYKPENDFDDSIKDIAGFILEEKKENLRNMLIAEIINSMADTSQIEKNSFLEYYRRRSCLLGKDILVLKNGESLKAKAKAIDDNCHLQVEYINGSDENLSFGEVSVRY